MVTAPTQRAPIQRPFSVSIVPPLVPGRGLLYSFLLHAAVLAASLWLPWEIMLPPAPRLRSTQEIIAEAEFHDALILPPTEAPGGPGDAQQQVQGANGQAGLDGADAPRALPKAVYAGPQQIVVDSPKPVNSVQVIKRPDLISPPKLKYPLKLRSMLQLPAAAPMPALVAPTPAAIPVAAEEPLTTEMATVEKPVLVIKASTRKPTPASVSTPKLKVQQSDLSRISNNSASMPMLQAEPQASPTAAVAVINAVTAPDASSNVPMAELEGAFAVAMSSANLNAKVLASVGPTGRGSFTGGAGSGTGSGFGTPGGAGNGTGTGAGLGRGTASAGLGSGGPGSPRGSGAGGNGTGNGSGGGGNAVGSGAGTGGLPGITITGGGYIGSSPSAAASGAAKVQPPQSYGLTIVASGSSGGAIRDLGVFGRSETVYTVYLSMADAGGGPDCPMQYSVVPGQGNFVSNGLVTPPYAATKKVAKLPASSKSLGREVFVRGFIGTDGNVTVPYAVGGPIDETSKAAVESLQQWQFVPASIEGQPVKVKVLIGIYVTSQ